MLAACKQGSWDKLMINSGIETISSSNVSSRNIRLYVTKTNVQDLRDSEGVRERQSSKAS